MNIPITPGCRSKVGSGGSRVNIIRRSNMKIFSNAYINKSWRMLTIVLGELDKGIKIEI